jgi:hypothetical protein
MSILERITALEERVEELRIIDTEDIMAEDTGDGIELHLQSPGNAEPASADGYEGYFKVIKSGENLAVVDGADPSATIAGYTKAGNVRIAVNKAEIDVSQQGYIYIETTYEYSYKCEIKYTASFNVPPDSDGKHIRIIADYSDYGNKIIQRLYGENEITGKWV